MSHETFCRKVTCNGLVCCIAAPKFKDFKHHFQNSRAFQGSSKIAIETQGLFKNFKDLSEIQGFQGIFQGCGHPVTNKQ